MEGLRKKIPSEGYNMYIKDCDTMIVDAGEGYYILHRIGYIDGVKEKELIDYMGEM